MKKKSFAGLFWHTHLNQEYKADVELLLGQIFSVGYLWGGEIFSLCKMFDLKKINTSFFFIIRSYPSPAEERETIFLYNSNNTNKMR